MRVDARVAPTRDAARANHARVDASLHFTPPTPEEVPTWTSALLSTGEPRPPEVFHGVTTGMPFSRARALAPAFFDGNETQRVRSPDFDGVQFDIIEYETSPGTSVVSDLVLYGPAVRAAATHAWGAGRSAIVGREHVTRWFGANSGWMAELGGTRANSGIAFRRYLSLAMLIGDGRGRGIVMPTWIGSTGAEVQRAVIAQGATIENFPREPGVGSFFLARFAPTEWDETECVLNIAVAPNGHVYQIGFDVPHGDSAVERVRIAGSFVRAWGTPTHREARDDRGHPLGFDDHPGNPPVEVHDDGHSFHVRVGSAIVPR